MKIFILTVIAICLLSAPVFSQDQNNIAAFGLGYSSAANPGIMGWGAYGRLVGGSTAVYTDYDIFRATVENSNVSVAGLRLKYTIRTGIAQRLFSLKNKASLWGLFNGGVAADGQSVSRSLQWGGFVDVPIKKGFGALVVLAAEDDPITGRNFAPRIGLRVKF